MRVFFVGENGTIKRISNLTYDKWVRAGFELSDFSNQRVKIALFFGTVESRRLSHIEYAEFVIREATESGAFHNRLYVEDLPFYKKNDLGITSIHPRKRSVIRLNAESYGQSELAGATLRACGWAPTREQMQEFVRQMFPAATELWRRSKSAANVYEITRFR